MLRRARVLGLCALIVCIAAACVPIISDPIPGTPAIYGGTTFDLGRSGYRETEFFLSGAASAYSPVQPLTSDGKWSVKPVSPALYKTRAVVRRPIDPAKFNGTVIVEWLNVSGGVDASPDWLQTHVELIRRGYAWVGVSAQTVGLDQLKASDPARYGSLSHPGDSYSYDIFTQAGEAVVGNPGRILSGLRPLHVIAAGESQSAGRMVTYVDAVHPLVHVYDGFLVHSRAVNGAPLSQSPLPAVGTPVPTLIRSDGRQPVLIFNTETDTSALQARQADTPWIRIWEMAGTAHYDQYGLVDGATDLGDLDGATLSVDSLQHPTSNPVPGLLTCASPINAGFASYALRAAIFHLNNWVVTGKLPPTAQRLATTSISPAAYQLDANGNVLGGIRSPAVDAPVSTLSGLGQAGASFCRLFGTTVPFTSQQLHTLYPTHRDFVVKWNAAVAAARTAGFLLPEDAVNLRQAAANTRIPD
jgi:hypothetical protein